MQLVEEDINSEILVLYHDKASSDKPLEVDLQLEGKPLRMEVDTGAAVSLVSEETYRSLFPTVQLQFINDEAAYLLRGTLDHSWSARGSMGSRQQSYPC